jgi:hypothetical protein
MSTLAYFGSLSVSKENSFITLKPVFNVKNLVSLSQTKS